MHQADVLRVNKVLIWFHPVLLCVYLFGKSVQEVKVKMGKFEKKLIIEEKLIW